MLVTMQHAPEATQVPTWIPNDCIAADRGIWHVPPDVVDDVAIPLMCVTSPAHNPHIWYWLWHMAGMARAEGNFVNKMHEERQEFCSHSLHQPQNVIVSTLEWLQSHHKPYSVHLHLKC